MKNRFLLTIACLFTSLLVPQALAENTKCDADKPIVFAGFDWDSAAFHNEVARYILEKGYGCETAQIPGATIPLFNGMLRGNVDISMEIWTQSIDKIWTDALEKGTVREVGTNFNDAVQAIFVPRYLVEGENSPAPNLKTVADLKNYKALFKDPEQPEKGRFYNCVMGWSCAEVNTKKLYVYGLNEDFVDFRPGSGNAISSAVESALRRKKPVVFYYWTPSWLIGKFKDDLVVLEEPAYNDEIWNKLIRNEQPEQATAYPAVDVNIGVNSRFADKSPVIIDFLKHYQTSSDLISDALMYMQENNAKAEEAAVYFLRHHPDIWRSWIPEDVAKRVEDSLK